MFRAKCSRSFRTCPSTYMSCIKCMRCCIISLYVCVREKEVRRRERFFTNMKQERSSFSKCFVFVPWLFSCWLLSCGATDSELTPDKVTAPEKTKRDSLHIQVSVLCCVNALTWKRVKRVPSPEMNTRHQSDSGGGGGGGGWGGL